MDHASKLLVLSTGDEALHVKGTEALSELPIESFGVKLICLGDSPSDLIAKPFAILCQN